MALILLYHVVGILEQREIDIVFELRPKKLWTHFQAIFMKDMRIRSMGSGCGVFQ